MVKYQVNFASKRLLTVFELRLSNRCRNFHDVWLTAVDRNGRDFASIDHLIEMKFILLFFCVSFGERNFRRRAFHKQLLRDEDKIIKMSSGISLRKSYQTDKSKSSKLLGILTSYRKSPGQCIKPKLAISDGATLTCPVEFQHNFRQHYIHLIMM